MKRDDRIISWERNASFKPLLIMGPARTGKTFLVNSFSEKVKYDCKVSIDCHTQKELLRLFSSEISNAMLIDSLDTIFHTNISSGHSLIFLDNIQYAPAVLSYLPALARDNSKLHVIAAGRPMNIPDAILDSFEVCHLSPFSFPEFLSIYNEKLYDAYNVATLEDYYYRKRFLHAYHFYLIIGGMPECINEWLNSKNLDNVTRIQKDLLKKNMSSFNIHGKYYGLRCREILTSIPSQLMTKQQKFLFSQVSTTRQARSYHDPLEDLINEGYILPVYDDNESGFIPFLFDVGLLIAMSGTNKGAVLNGNTPFMKQIMQNFLVQSCDSVRLSYHPDKYRRKDFIMDDNHYFRYGIESNRTKIRWPRNNKDRWIIFSETPYHQEYGRLYIPIYFAPKLSEMLDTLALG